MGTVYRRARSRDRRAGGVEARGNRAGARDGERFEQEARPRGADAPGDRAVRRARGDAERAPVPCDGVARGRGPGPDARQGGAGRGRERDLVAGAARAEGSSWPTSAASSTRTSSRATSSWSGGDAARTKLLDFGNRPGAPLPGLAGARERWDAHRRGPRDRRLLRRRSKPPPTPGWTSGTDVFALGCAHPLRVPHGRGGVLGRPGRRGAGQGASRRAAAHPAIATRAAGEARRHLVKRMLAKDRSKRPADARAVLRTSWRISEIWPAGPPAGTVSASSRGSRSVNDGSFASSSRSCPTDRRAATRGSIRKEVHSTQVGLKTTGTGSASRTAPGSASLGEAGPRTTTYARLQRGRWQLRRSIPAARIALATGRAQSTGGAPPGPVIDQAAELLTRSATEGVWIDELTAGHPRRALRRHAGRAGPPARRPATRTKTRRRARSWESSRRASVATGSSAPSTPRCASASTTPWPAGSWSRDRRGRASRGSGTSSLPGCALRATSASSRRAPIPSGRGPRSCSRASSCA